MGASTGTQGTAGVSPPASGLAHPQRDKLGCSEAPLEALVGLDPKGNAGHPHCAGSLGTLARQWLQAVVLVLWI